MNAQTKYQNKIVFSQKKLVQPFSKVNSERMYWSSSQKYMKYQSTN